MTDKEIILYKLGELEAAKKSINSTITLVSPSHSDATDKINRCLEKLSRSLASAFNDAETELMAIFKNTEKSKE